MMQDISHYAKTVPLYPPRGAGDPYEDTVTEIRGACAVNPMDGSIYDLSTQAGRDAFVERGPGGIFGMALVIPGERSAVCRFGIAGGCRIAVPKGCTVVTEEPMQQVTVTAASPDDAGRYAMVGDGFNVAVEQGTGLERIDPDAVAADLTTGKGKRLVPEGPLGPQPPRPRSGHGPLPGRTEIRRSSAIDMRTGRIYPTAGGGPVIGLIRDGNHGRDMVFVQRWWKHSDPHAIPGGSDPGAVCDFREDGCHLVLPDGYMAWVTMLAGCGRLTVGAPSPGNAGMYCLEHPLGRVCIDHGSGIRPMDAKAMEQCLDLKRVTLEAAGIPVEEQHELERIERMRDQERMTLRQARGRDDDGPGVRSGKGTDGAGQAGGTDEGRTAPRHSNAVSRLLRKAADMLDGGREQEGLSR